MTQGHRYRSLALWRLALLLSLAVLFLLEYDEAPSPAFLAEEAIHRLFAGARWIEPRLSLPQAFEPCRQATHSGLIPTADCSPRRIAVEDKRLMLRAYRLLRAGALSDARRGRQDLALWHLLIGRDLPSLEASIEHMTAAAELGREDPATLSDLGALHYLRAVAAGDPHGLEEGLRWVDRALEIDPGRIEALFNRALLVEALYLPAAARDAWREYLRRERPASPWSREGLDHLARLDTPATEDHWRQALREAGAGIGPPDGERLQHLARAFPEDTREWIETALLPTWAEAQLEGRNREANDRLQTAKLAAAALADSSGDVFLSCQVAEVERTATDLDEVRVRHLAQSLRVYRDARTAFVQTRPAEALELFRRAESRLNGGETCLREEIRYYQAASLFAQGRYAETERLLRSLCEAGLGRHYDGLAGRIESFLGLIQNLTGAPESGRDRLLQALGHLRDPAYLSDAAFAHVVLGESYDTLGDRDSAWLHFYTALQQNPGRSPYRTVQIYNSLADFTLRLGNPALSYLYQDAAVKASRGLNNPSFAADVLLWRALLQARLGRPSDARHDLALAAAQGARITDPSRYRRFHADISLVLGTTSLDQCPLKAVAHLQEAVNHYEALGHWPSLLLAYEALAQAHRAIGDSRAEKADLEKSLALYEQAGRALQDDSMRIALAGTIENVFDHMAEFLVTREKRPERAVYYIERAKTLNWPVPQIRPLEVDPEESGATRHRLPPRTALVEYAVLPDRLLVWVETSNSREFHEQHIPGEQIDRLVERFSDGDWSHSEWRRVSDTLFRLLLDSWFVPGRFETLIIVPDKSLFRISFAALWNAGRQHFLIEDATLVVSPSAALFALANQRDRVLAGRGAGKVLVIASSKGSDGRLLLPRLDRADAEGSRIRELFPALTVLLSGAEAVPAAFFQRAREARFIHFAGHAIAFPDRPLDSMLVLASPGPGQRGEITGREIQSLAFPLTRLVTLSACSTAAASRKAWPGALSLARPFLTAGVPAVLGSLWEVNDADAEQLFGSFYAALRQGENPAKALRTAQVRLLTQQGRDHVQKSGWPAFEIIGGPVLD